MDTAGTSATVHPEFTTPSTRGEELSADGCMPRKSHVGMQLGDPEPTEEGLELQNHGPDVSDKLRSRCVQLGMLPEAVDGWARYHVNPMSAIVYHMAAQCFVFNLTLSMVLGVPMRTYPAIAWVVALFIQFGQAATIWRVGPCFTKFKLGRVSYGMYMGTSFGTQIACFLGAAPDMKYDPIVFTVMVALFVWGRGLLNQIGFNPVNSPSEPQKHYGLQAFRALVLSGRLIDCLTDLTFFQVLMRERRSGCWWFGQAGLCSTFTALIAVLLLCAAADIFAATYMHIMHAHLVKRRRILLVFHCVSMVCEVGVVAVTLLHLMSGGNPDQQSTERRQELGSVVASLVSTILMFVMTILGAGNAFSGIKVVVQRISAAGQSMMIKSRLTAAETKALDITDPK